MKYLKTYTKLFESNDHRFATEEELNTIEDILLGIKDQDYEIEIHKNIGGENEKLEEESEVCRFYIEKFTSGFDEEPQPVEYIPDDEFISVLQHLVSYVDEIGYIIEITSFFTPGVAEGMVDKVSSDESMISDDDISKLCKYEINYMKIVIYYKD